MGRERKRGAICDLAKLICEGDKEPFCLITNELPEGIEYCITLDSDTILPPGAAAELIGCMEHPLNAPEIFGGTVRRGYGMIAPRMASTSKGAAKSFFARIISGSTGVDVYFPTAPEFYQDVFGRGSFGGKGIFHIRTFMDTAMVEPKTPCEPRYAGAVSADAVTQGISRYTTANRTRSYPGGSDSTGGSGATGSCCPF